MRNIKLKLPTRWSMKDPVRFSDHGSSIGTLKFNDRNYAIGLHWETMDNPDQGDREARARAGVKQIAADCYCTRLTTTSQYGLGFRRLGHRPGMRSLASELAFCFEGNWLGLFEISNGYYVLGVINEGIFAETDRYFLKIEDAVQYFQCIREVADWDVFYANFQSDIDGLEITDAINLIESNPTVTLKGIRNWRRTGVIPAIVSAICLGFLATVLTVNFSEEWQIASLLKHLGWQSDQEAESNSFNPEAPLPPWSGKSQGFAVLESCVDNIGRFDPTIPGWKVKSLSCDGNMASAKLSRFGKLGGGGGSITWILPFARKSVREPFLARTRSGSSDSVEVNWQLEELPGIPDNHRNVPISRIRTALLNTFEHRMIPIALTESGRNANWQALTFRFSTQDDPLIFADLLEALPIFTTNLVQYEMEPGTWTIEGKAYEKIYSQKSPAN